MVTGFVGVSLRSLSIYFLCHLRTVCWNIGILVELSCKRMWGMRSICSSSLPPVDVINCRLSWRKCRYIGTSSLCSANVERCVFFVWTWWMLNGYEGYGCTWCKITLVHLNDMQDQFYYAAKLQNQWLKISLRMQVGNNCRLIFLLHVIAEWNLDHPIEFLLKPWLSLDVLVRNCGWYQLTDHFGLRMFQHTRLHSGGGYELQLAWE